MWLTALLMMLAAVGSAPAAPVTELAQAVTGRIAAEHRPEPSWRLDIVPGQPIRFRDQPLLAEMGTDIDFPPAVAQPAGAGFVFTSIGEDATLTATLSAETCVDDETTYPYSIRIQTTGPRARDYKGCAYRPWSQDLEAYLPAIDACLAIGAGPYVLFARREPAGNAYLVTSAPGNDGVYVCTVSDGKATQSLAPDGGAYPNVPGVTDSTFVRAPAPKGTDLNCPKTKEARSAAGGLLGWWILFEGLSGCG